ncbi:MAG: DUF1800 family protein, partial [Myxococcota bacterium]
GNQKANLETGQVPDENYAREILQLFSVGLVQLNPDGTPALDANGQTQELYNNNDITGLAKVFTGLDLQIGEPDCWGCPMVIREEWHSTAEKTFLGQTIPANTPARESIRQALDIIFAHPNVGPFVSRQLIQRFVTSDPTPAYVGRVSGAFDVGSFMLPNGTPVGTGQRGDLAATLAAILFDAEARSDLARQDPRFGKIREPVLRLTHWARAFNADVTHPEYFEPLWNPDLGWAYSQHPYQSPSVFNFYRPGYVAPGTLSGAAGMTVPELQITNVSSIPSDANFLQDLIFRTQEELDFEAYNGYFLELGLPSNEMEVRRTFTPDYTTERMMASDPAALVGDLDRFLCFGTMRVETKQEIEGILNAVTNNDALRIQLAVYLVMTSADYIVQR